MEDCIFCKIARKEIESDIKLETSSIIVFPDKDPQTKHHLLIIPKEHFTDVSETPDAIWVDIKAAALTLKESYKVEGFRLVNNYGTSAMIQHMHVHFLADVSKEEKL